MYLYDRDGHMLEFYADVAADWRALYRRLEGSLISGAWDPEAAEPLTESRTEASPEIRPRPGSVLPARATTCAGLPVDDLDAAVAFYTDVIGLRVDPAVSGDHWALLAGSGGTCDVCLVESKDVKATKLLFGGIQMESGRPVRDAFEDLRRQDVPAAIVGDDASGALVVSDPDGITLVYSVASFGDVMDQSGDELVDTVSRAL
jgi:catechol 2,3-dioxygenase-like lactoylglutathione lyase family enzyme